MAETPTPLVISGPPRTGTTLFSALIDGHPEINWIPDEAYFMEHLWMLDPAHGHAGFVAFANGDRERFVAGIRDRLLMPSLDIPLIDFPSLSVAWDAAAFSAALSARGRFASVQDVWDGLVHAYLAGLRQAPRRFICIKAADVGRSVMGALRYFDTARTIVVVRDPKKMMNSLKRYRDRSNRKRLSWPTFLGMLDDMNSLARFVDAARDRSSPSAPRRLFVVRYEDVVSDRERVMTEVAEFLDLSLTASMVEPTMLGESWTNNSSFVKEAGRDTLPADRPDTLTDDERHVMDIVLEPFRKTFGYE